MERERDPLREKLKDLLLSGGISGAALGGAGSLVGGAKSWGQAAKAAGKGGLVFGGLAAGSGLMGNLLMGTPDENDSGGNTTRGAVGGALAGGALGAAAGALSRSKPVREALLRQVEPGGILSKGIRGLRGGRAVTAGLGIAGALIGGHMGADEGMQVDYIDALRRERQRKAMMEAFQDAG